MERMTTAPKIDGIFHVAKPFCGYDVLAELFYFYFGTCTIQFHRSNGVFEKMSVNRRAINHLEEDRYLDPFNPSIKIELQSGDDFCPSSSPKRISNVIDRQPKYLTNN